MPARRQPPSPIQHPIYSTVSVSSTTIDTQRPPSPTHILSTQQPPSPTPRPILNGLRLRYTSHLLNSLLSQHNTRYSTASVSDTPPIWSTASRYKRAPVGSRLKSRTAVRPPIRPPPAVRRPSLPRFQYHAARPTRRPPVGVPRVPPGIYAPYCVDASYFNVPPSARPLGSRPPPDPPAR